MPIGNNISIPESCEPMRQGMQRCVCTICKKKKVPLRWPRVVYLGRTIPPYWYANDPDCQPPSDFSSEPKRWDPIKKNALQLRQIIIGGSPYIISDGRESTTLPANVVTRAIPHSRNVTSEARSERGNVIYNIGGCSTWRTRDEN